MNVEALRALEKAVEAGASLHWLLAPSSAEAYYAQPEGGPIYLVSADDDNQSSYSAGVGDEMLVSGVSYMDAKAAAQKPRIRSLIAQAEAKGVE